MHIRKAAMGVAMALALSGCEPSTGPRPPSGPPQANAQTPVVQEQPHDPKVEKACMAYGKMAGAFATDRDNGIPFSQQIRDIKAKFGTTPVAIEMRTLADLLYNKPWANKLSPEGAPPVFYSDCIMRVEITRDGGRSFTSKEDIGDALKDFKTFNGKPLVFLLRDYGIKIASVETVPVEHHWKYFKRSQDQPGDVIFTMILASKPTKAMPCRLREWVIIIKGDVLPMAEFERRGQTFPIVRPDDDDPLIYWAATGKCSEAYSY